MVCRRHRRHASAVYDVVFTPDDGGEPVHQPQALPTGGGRLVPDDTQGQALLTLDPLQAGDPRLLDASQPNGKQNGTFQVVPVELGPDDWNADSLGQVSFDGEQTGVTGAMVPSSQGPGGQKHFVSPKAAGGTVVLRASLPKDVHFEDLYTWEVTTAADGLVALAYPEGATIQVPRDVPGQYVVRVMAKPQVPAGGGPTPAPTQEITRLNVWIVWADITSAPIPIQYGHPAGIPADQVAIAGGYKFVHTIIPQSIVQNGIDIPNLDNDTKAPAGLNPCAESLADGADNNWDSTRHRRVKIIAPSWYVPSCIDYPDSYLLDPNDPDYFNDDADTADETNDPYENNGHLTGGDFPRRTLSVNDGDVGDKFEARYQFEEFTRLKIGQKWYLISDPYPWKIHFKFIRLYWR